MLGDKIGVLQRGDRIQITADVGLEDIATFKEILGKYEAILRLMEAISPQTVAGSSAQASNTESSPNTTASPAEGSDGH